MHAWGTPRVRATRPVPFSPCSTSSSYQRERGRLPAKSEGHDLDRVGLLGVVRDPS